MELKDIAAISGKYCMNLFARAPVCFERGEGAWAYGTDGKKYLDFIGGIAVNALGHSHPAVVSAICEQAGKMIHCSNLYHIKQQALAARTLVEASCADRAFFCNSGAEANEAAIKLARLYQNKQGRPWKSRIVTLMGSFHGRTLATVAACGQPKYHKPFEPLPPWFDYVPFNDADALRAAVSEEHTAAVMLEAVQGESGVHVASQAFIEAAAEACEKAGALLIFDEVQTGLGRTGTLFAYERYGVEPDVVTLAKALGGGFPVGAMIARERAAAAFEPGDHGSTFGGNPLACAAVLASLEQIIGGKLHERAKASGERLLGRLASLADRSQAVREARGLGLMAAVELASPCAAKIKDMMLESGVLVGSVGDSVLRFLPPLIVTAEEVDIAADALEAALLAQA